MPRIARIVIPGVLHHITQRGNNRDRIFFDDEDFNNYLRILAKQSEKYEFVIEAFCLMPNHLHIVGTPVTSHSLSKAVGRSNFVYTQYINDKYDRSGHLWQNRFFSCPMDMEHSYKACLYVEQNPVRAGLVDEATAYAWSSARYHCGLFEKPEFLSFQNWMTWTDSDTWKKELHLNLPDDVARNLQKNTKAGTLFANDSFIAQMEKKTGLKLRKQPVGRPPKIS